VIITSVAPFDKGPKTEILDYLVSSDRDLLDMRHYQGIAIVSPGQFLLALELHAMDSAAIAARFAREVLRDIQANIPLEPETAARVEEALVPISIGSQQEQEQQW
jgi:hypothetical protein